MARGVKTPGEGSLSRLLEVAYSGLQGITPSAEELYVASPGFEQPQKSVHPTSGRGLLPLAPGAAVIPLGLEGAGGEPCSKREDTREETSWRGE